MRLHSLVRMFEELQQLRARLLAPTILPPVWVFNNIPAGARVDTRRARPFPRRRK